jgi:hypothetical protein
MELGDAFIDQFEHLLGSHGRRDQRVGLGIVLETIEARRQPPGNSRAAFGGKAGNLLE